MALLKSIDDVQCFHFLGVLTNKVHDDLDDLYPVPKLGLASCGVRVGNQRASFVHGLKIFIIIVFSL
jgi:hypothetical protein